MIEDHSGKCMVCTKIGHEYLQCPCMEAGINGIARGSAPQPSKARKRGENKDPGGAKEAPEPGRACFPRSESKQN